MLEHFLLNKHKWCAHEELMSLLLCGRERACGSRWYCEASVSVTCKQGAVDWTASRLWATCIYGDIMKECKYSSKDELIILLRALCRSLCTIQTAIIYGHLISYVSYSRFWGGKAKAQGSCLANTTSSLYWSWSLHSGLLILKTGNFLPRLRTLWSSWEGPMTDGLCFVLWKKKPQMLMDSVVRNSDSGAACLCSIMFGVSLGSLKALAWYQKADSALWGHSRRCCANQEENSH